MEITAKALREMGEMTLTFVQPATVLLIDVNLTTILLLEFNKKHQKIHGRCPIDN